MRVLKQAHDLSSDKHGFKPASFMNPRLSISLICLHLTKRRCNQNVRHLTIPTCRRKYSRALQLIGERKHKRSRTRTAWPVVCLRWVQAQPTIRSRCGHRHRDSVGPMESSTGKSAEAEYSSQSVIGLTNPRVSAAVPPNPARRARVQGPGYRSVYANERLERPNADRVSSIHHGVVQAL